MLVKPRKSELIATLHLNIAILYGPLQNWHFVVYSTHTINIIYTGAETSSRLTENKSVTILAVNCMFGFRTVVYKKQAI